MVSVKPPRAVCEAIRAAWNWVFRPAARYPADPRAVFMLALSVFGGLGALALNAAPQTLEALLPVWGIIAWGISLALGSAVALTGMLFQSINGIITEQIGSVMVGAATVFYSVLALYTLGFQAVQIIGLVLAWGLACLIRWAQLQALIVSTYHRAQEEGLLE